MKFLNLTQHIGLIILIILINIYNDFAVHGKEPLDIRSINISPHHYDIALNLQSPMSEYKANVSVEIQIDIRDKTKNIYVHAANNIHIVSCDIMLVYNGRMQAASQIIYDRVSEIQKFEFVDYLYPEKYTLIMQYSVFLNDVTEQVTVHYSFRPDYSDKDFQVTGTYQFIFNARSDSTHRIFPCWDEPSFKSTFSISVILPTYYNAFSCTPIISKMTWEYDSRKTKTIFEKTPLISTYLVGILITSFNVTSEAVDKIILWYNPESINITFVRDVANNVLQSLTSYSNYNHILSQMDMIILPGDFQITQKWGMSVYSVDAIKYNEEIDSFERKVKVAATVARGVMDQLLGNVVSPSFWSHSWLHEGMVSFFQLNAFAKVFETFPTDIFIIRFADDNNTDPLIQNIMYGNHTKNIQPSSVTPYNRVPFILRMLQYIISQEVFESGINAYLKQYKFGLEEPYDLWTTFEHVLDSLLYGPNRKLSWLPTFRLKGAIDACLFHKDDFELIVTREYITGNVEIYLQTLDEVNGNNSNWVVPFTYTLRNVSNFAISMLDFLNPVTKRSFYIGTNKNDWIIVNLHRIGCYRINYDSTNLYAIAHYLNHDDYTIIPVLNRAQIIEDAYYFMIKRRITFHLFLNIINYLKLETDYTVWYSMEPIVRYIWDICKNSQYIKIKVNSI